MKNKRLGINAILNVIKSGLSVLFPLITYPYAFRVLHADGIGKVNYAASIVSYFILIAGLGISTYAVREGAKVRDDKEQICKFSNEIFSINILSMLLSYCLLGLCLLFFKSFHEYVWLILIHSVSIFFITIGVDWINIIYEDYLYIVIRCIIIYVLNITLLFIFVKTAEDYYHYAWLTVNSNILVGLLNYMYCKKKVRPSFTIHINVKEHWKSIATLFANQVAISIYVNADTTMLGLMCGDYYVGLYACAAKVYTVLKNMLAAIYTVALPRISYCLANNDRDRVKEICTSMMSILSIIVLPASIGLILISKEIIMIMGGQEYIEAVITLQILGFSLIGAIYGGMITVCINVASGREKINMRATTLSAIINIFLNIFFIHIWGQNGAALTTLLSEFFVFIYCAIKIRDIEKYIEINIAKKNFVQAVLGCVPMAVVSYCVHLWVENIVLSLILIVAMSCAVYITTLFILKNEIAIGTADRIYSMIKKG